MTNTRDGGRWIFLVGAILSLLTYSPAWASDDSWPANRMVEPGNPARSRLYTCLTGQSRPRMPYTGGALPEAQVAAVARWIEDGAGEAGFAKVLPLFRARCLSCHSTASNGGNLALDSYAAMRRTIESYHGNSRAQRWEALYGRVTAAPPAAAR